MSGDSPAAKRVCATCACVVPYTAHAAAIAGHLDCLKASVRKGSKKVSRNGDTIMHVAAKHGHAECLRYVSIRPSRYSFAVIKVARCCHLIPFPTKIGMHDFVHVAVKFVCLPVCLSVCQWNYGVEHCVMVDCCQESPYMYYYYTIDFHVP